MPRSFTYCSAHTLRVKSSGESNREAWFLTAEEGVLRATVFGGPKSRLRAQVAPFHSGKLWIYHDPVRDSRKVNDFDVISYRTGMRELYERVMAADAVAETILSSHGSGGGWPAAAKLAGSVLDALNDAGSPALCSRIGVYFLWHWADLLGVRPDLCACASCEMELSREEAVWYSSENEALFCEHCFRNAAASNTALFDAVQSNYSTLRVGPGARLWLNEIAALPPTALVRVSLDNPSLEQARALSKAVLAAALGKRLPTWEGI